MAPPANYNADEGFDSHPDFPELKTKVLPHNPNGSEAPVRDAPTPYKAPRHRGLDADPSFPNLIKPGVTRIDLTPSIGTQLDGVQVSELSNAARDELALLISQRGVVFFRDQQLSDLQQGQLFDYFDRIERDNPEETTARIHDIIELEPDYRQTYVYYPWKFADSHADGTFQVNPPHFSLLKITKLPQGGGGDTVWTSQYGTYDALSKPYRNFVTGLRGVHSSRSIYDAAVQFQSAKGGNTKKGRTPPVETHHPLVITHPVTKWRSLYYNSNFVSRIAGLKYYESKSLEEFLTKHIENAQDHQVRFRWEENSLAIWDNFAALHRATHDYYPNPRAGRRATSLGAIPSFDPASKSRKEVFNQGTDIEQVKGSGITNGYVPDHTGEQTNGHGKVANGH